ncbi:MAG: hypothetical protein ACSHXY_07085 [Alphaproteobacteria bacterium]
MTFRTTDIDAGHTALTTDVTAPARSVRRRRRAAALSHRTGGVRISGLGI